jgi:hypothetical protein
MNINSFSSLAACVAAIFLNFCLPASYGQSLAGGNFTFGFRTTNGLSYNLQQATNLGASYWEWMTNITASSSNTVFITPVTNSPQQFFRLAQTLVPSGLVAYYPFQGNANDFSGYGNNAIIASNLVYQTGEAGLAATFDGISSYCEVAESPSVILTNYVSITAWVNPTQENGLECIVDKDYNFQGYNLYLVGSQVIMRISGALGSTATQGGTVPLNTWSHVAGVFDGTNILIYVNGGLAASQSSSFGLINSPKDLYIGMWGYPGSGRQFPGQMEYIRVYNRALSQAEVQSLSTSGQ